MNFLPRRIDPTLAGYMAAAALALSAGHAVAQELAVTHCHGSCPRYSSALVANNSKLVIHHLYAAGLNRYNRRPDWVAYRVTGAAVGIASLLPREWQPDRLAGFSAAAELAELEPDSVLPDVSSNANAYGGSPPVVTAVLSRVHLAPLTGFAKTPYWAELNNTSNMLLMPAPLRQGPWLRLEQKINNLVSTREEVHVIAGPVYFDIASPGSDSLQPGVNLAGYYKVLVAASGTAAFLFPHDLRQHESFCDQLASVGEIEDLTGLELFPDRYLAESPELLGALGCRASGSP